MKKIPTLFERDWEGDRSRVFNQVHAGCEWVLIGEGVATRKLDGTCCMARGSQLFKRRELRPGEAKPHGFEEAGYDEETKKTVGWVPVGPGTEDRWHREALSRADVWPDGTYELVGPKIQGDPEDWGYHCLVSHSGHQVQMPWEDPPRTFDGLREWFADKHIEGIVFHHPDGRMAKIKKRDFGLRR